MHRGENSCVMERMQGLTSFNCSAGGENSWGSCITGETLDMGVWWCMVVVLGGIPDELRCTSLMEEMLVWELGGWW